MTPCILTSVFGTDEATLGSCACVLTESFGDTLSMLLYNLKPQREGVAAPECVVASCLIAQNTNTKILVGEDGAATQLICLWQISF